MKWNYRLAVNGVNPQKIRNAQVFIDSEILRRSDPLVPFDTGSLKRSGITDTRVGTGIITYSTPYAKRQYFAGKSSGQRGRKWVKRMWTAQGTDILRHARERMGES